MAKNYSLWCEHLTLRNQDEIDWMEDALNAGTTHANMVDYLKSAFGIEVAKEHTEDWPGFEYTFDSKGVMLFSTAYGNLDNLGAIIKAFLAKFEPHGYFTIEWADTCSKPNPGEFGGGAAFITATKIDHISTISWIDDKVKNYYQK